MSDLPAWLARGVFAFDGSTIFAVDRVQQAKPPNKGTSLLAGDGSRRSLGSCRKAAMGDLLKAQVFIDQFGKTCRVSFEGSVVTLSDSVSTAKVRIPQAETEFDKAVLSFVKAFDGEIVEDWEVVS